MLQAGSMSLDDWTDLDAAYLEIFCKHRAPLAGELDPVGVAAVAFAFVWALYAGIRMGRVALGYAETVEQARTYARAAAARGGE